MKYILFFGASSTHGVGGSDNGWADNIKRSLHEEMYGPTAKGQICEVYELGIPGTDLADMTGRLASELGARTNNAAPDNVYLVFLTGTNDSRTSDQPDDFAASAHSFIHLAKDFSNHILAVGLTPVDESKTGPTNPVAGRQSYFSNGRVRQFEEALVATCQQEHIRCVPLFDRVPADWQQAYLFRDGLHPNKQGHEWIRSQVEPELRDMLGTLS